MKCKKCNGVGDVLVRNVTGFTHLVQCPLCEGSGRTIELEELGLEPLPEGYVCYLLHFHQMLGGARHYLGATSDLVKRLEGHRQGTGCVTTARFIALGIGFDLVRVWRGGYAVERRLKRNGAVSWCPICSPGGFNGRYRTKVKAVVDAGTQQNQTNEKPPQTVTSKGRKSNKT